MYVSDVLLFVVITDIIITTTCLRRLDHCSFKGIVRAAGLATLFPNPAGLLDRSDKRLFIWLIAIALPRAQLLKREISSLMVVLTIPQGCLNTLRRQRAHRAQHV